MVDCVCGRMVTDIVNYGECWCGLINKPLFAFIKEKQSETPEPFKSQWEIIRRWKNHAEIKLAQLYFPEEEP